MAKAKPKAAPKAAAKKTTSRASLAKQLAAVSPSKRQVAEHNRKAEARSKAFRAASGEEQFKQLTGGKKVRGLNSKKKLTALERKVKERNGLKSDKAARFLAQDVAKGEAAMREHKSALGRTTTQLLNAGYKVGKNGEVLKGRKVVGRIRPSVKPDKKNPDGRLVYVAEGDGKGHDFSKINRRVSKRG